MFVNTTGDDAFAKCIEGKVARWRFDGIDTEGDMVSAPFVFSPKN